MASQLRRPSSRLLLQPHLASFKADVEFAAEYGLDFEVIEFTDPKLDAEEFKELLEKYQRLASMLGAVPKPKFETLHAPFIDVYLSSADREVRQLGFTKVVRAAEAARDLGISAIILHTNYVPDVATYEGYTSNWIEGHTEVLRRLLSNLPVTIIMENMFERDPSIIAALHERVNDFRFQSCVNIGHCNVFSSVPIERWMHLLGDRITYLHFTDNHGDSDSSLQIGAGTVDWGSVDLAIRQWCPQADVLIEISDRGLEAVRGSLDFLRNRGLYPFSR